MINTKHKTQITLTTEDIEAALIAYVQQKIGTLTDIDVQITIGKDRNGAWITAAISGYTRDDKPPAS